ncbi:uracil-DNA glycosylase [Bacillus niameyensis]|uniref:uracil-DNA glycosylase n=1 Tax=Bacillus niameyensis TaxID=1522308 RepID=UPI00078133F7|nr:uracil-DNA glycosylase [Bacillus niameyensis]
MHDFCPKIWQEDPAPETERNCQDCGLYKHGSRVIWGEGNPKAPILVILDNPGAREDRDGNTIICGTRQTLQRAINQVGLTQEDIYVSYILKRRPVRAYDKDKTRNICIHHLYDQMHEQNPRLILCLGNVAVQSFFQDKNVDVKYLRGAWHMISGKKVTVAYHPLAVRRRPNLWESFLEDWQLVSDLYNKL